MAAAATDFTGVLTEGFTGATADLATDGFCAERVVLLGVTTGVTTGLEAVGLDEVGLVTGTFEVVAGAFEVVVVCFLVEGAGPVTLPINDQQQVFNATQIATNTSCFLYPALHITTSHICTHCTSANTSSFHSLGV